MKKWTRNGLLRSSVLAGFCLASAGAYAQQQPTETDDPAAGSAPSRETITVTGSRIARTGFDLTQPTEVIDSSYIELRQFTNAADAVGQLPGVAQISPRLGNNVSSANSGVGQNVISLYGLGSQRTLTLIDGRRFVSSNSPVGGAGAPGSQVDLNNIPMSLIERVEVVKVGGAAVYGADAVAGVVNYILRRDFEGVQVSSDWRNFGGLHDGYASEFSVRGLMGGNFANGRGNITLALEYNELPTIARSEVPSRAEQWSLFTPVAANRVLRADNTWPVNQVRLIQNPRAGILSNGGVITPGPTLLSNIGLGSWGGTAGFIQFNSDGSGSVVPYNPGQPVDNIVWAAGGDGLDLAATNTSQEGYERFNTALLGSYELAPWLNFNLSVFRNRVTSDAPGFQTWYSTGVFGGTARALLFNSGNPFLSTSARAEIEAAAGGPTDFYMHKAWADEFGARRVFNENNVESYSFSFDGEFELMNRTWSWELAHQLGRSTIFSRRDEPSDHRWFAAMDVGINPGTGELDCRFNYEAGYQSALLPAGFGVAGTETLLGVAGDCHPFNPFGGASQESIDYILVPMMRFTTIEQEITAGYVTGDLFNLPAGPLGVAFGFENRREFADAAVDGTNVMGVTKSGLATGAGGAYRSWDLYAETIVPLISSDMGLPFIYDLNLEASYRAIDSDRAGRDQAWAVGLNWNPIEDIRFRVNYAETVRAPAVTELFLPRVLTSQFAADPCHGPNRGNGPNPAVRQANCDAQGIPDTFVSVATNASRRGVTGGNPDLTNEQATSINYGVIFTPRWVEGLAVSVDFTRIEITDAITQFTLTNIMEACYDSTDFPNQFCGMFVRGGDFQLPALDAFTSGYVNAALRDFDTVEIAVRYDQNVDAIPLLGNVTTNLFGDRDLGRFSGLVRAYNVQTNTTSATGFDFSDTVGQHNNPRWRGDIRLSHMIGQLTSFVDINYSGSGKVNIFSTEPLQYIDQNGQPYTNLPGIWTFNLGGSYDLTDTLSIRGSVQNVGDWYPGPTEIAVGRGTFGRVFSLGLTARF